MSPAATPPPEPENEVKLTFWDHLRELRKRIVLALYGLIAGMAVVGWFVGPLVDKLMEPVLLALKPHTMSAAAKAALAQAAASPGLADTARAALNECATQPIVSPVAKQALVAFGQGSGLARALRDALEDCANMPEALEPAKKLVFTSAIEPMMVYFKVAIYGGVFVAAPWILFQVWQFIAPGLYKKEKRLVVPFLFWGTLLFYSGAAFCYFLVMPQAFPAMLQFASTSTMTPMLSITEQLGLVMAMLLGFGVVFEYPVIIAFLAMVGLVSAEWLSKYRRFAMVANTFLAAIITPTGDPINLALMAIPMCVFYEIGIVLARVLGKRRAAESAIQAT